MNIQCEREKIQNIFVRFSHMLHMLARIKRGKNNDEETTSLRNEEAKNTKSEYTRYHLLYTPSIPRA